MRIPVFVSSDDPVSELGVAALLRGRPELELVDELDIDSARVAVVAVDEIDEAAQRRVRAVQRNGCPRVVLVVSKLDDRGVLAGVEAGASALLRRADASPERLATTVVSVNRGEGSMPPDLLGRLLEQVGELQRNVLSPRGFTMSGLTEREIDVLRLVADGLDTAQIGHELAYSDRTVKNIIHDVTTRLHLRNRSHAVAYAVRQGLI